MSLENPFIFGSKVMVTSHKIVAGVGLYQHKPEEDDEKLLS